MSEAHKKMVREIDAMKSRIADSLENAQRLQCDALDLVEEYGVDPDEKDFEGTYGLDRCVVHDATKRHDWDDDAFEQVFDRRLDISKHTGLDIDKTLDKARNGRSLTEDEAYVVREVHAVYADSMDEFTLTEKDAGEKYAALEYQLENYLTK